MWLTTGEAAALARRSPATVRSWVSRGHLTPERRTPGGWPLFTAAKVLEAERDARRRDTTGRSSTAVTVR